MEKLERVELFSSKKELFSILLLFFLLFIFTLLKEYYNYKEFTKFDSQLIVADVLRQYSKTKELKNNKTKIYQVLKLKTQTPPLNFYTTAPISLENYREKRVLLELFSGDITFLEYLKGFFAYSTILQQLPKENLKEQLSKSLERIHKQSDLISLYKALYFAQAIPSHLQKKFSDLGISHLIAISGFHLGVLSTLLFFLIKYPYKSLQKRLFPYRSYSRDSFFIISLILLGYMLFINSPPSLLRAFAMLCVGFYLYDRGVKIVSMQTLLLTFLLLIALFPKLLFSIGFFLSLAGVFYIFLFLIYFKDKSRVWQFLLFGFWIYLMMLPYSLALFGNFSLYHPLSILWTSLFTLFYPLSILLHFIGLGDMLDGILDYLIKLEPHSIELHLPYWTLIIEVVLSFVAIFKKEALYLLLLYTLFIFIYSIYHVT